MVKRTQFKDAARNIKRKSVSWLSIATIMAIGMTGLLGLRSSAYAMKEEAVTYLDKYNYKDFELISNVGVSEEDLELVRSVKGVRDAEGVVEIPALVKSSGEAHQLNVYSEKKKVSIMLISDGKKPVEPYECALCQDLMDDFSLSLGDTVSVNALSETHRYVIRTGDYIVTGVVDDPDHISRGHSHYALFPDSAINTPALGNDYTKALIDTDAGVLEDPFDIGYYSSISRMKRSLEDTFDELTKKEEERLRSLDAKDAPEPGWMLIGRSVDASFIGLDSSYRAIASMDRYFTPLFALVAFMVCFSTITIIVEEQKKEIGTQKAMGMKDRQILFKYMLFGITAAICGIVIGAGGALGMEYVINGSIGERYLFGFIPLKLDMRMYLYMSVAFLLVTVTAVFISSYRLIGCSAVGLINGSEPEYKKKWKARKRTRHGMRIYLGLILSNLTQDLSRVLVSILIVLESVLMIGTGFTLRQSVWKAIDEQTKDIWRYDVMIETDGSEDALRNTEQLLESMGTDHICIHKENCVMNTFRRPEQTGVRLYSSDSGDDRFNEFFSLTDEKGRPLYIPETGMLITEEMYEMIGLVPGNRLELVNTDFLPGSEKITGVFNNRLDNYAIMSDETYESMFGSVPDKNCFLVKCGMTDADTVIRGISGEEGVKEIWKTEEELSQYDEVMTMFSIILLIVIIMVIILAFAIQLNLSNIQISRRMRDILIMRVNGFSVKQVIEYLAGEAVLITAQGIVFGILIGVPFAGYIIKNIDIPQFMFVSEPFVPAWIVSGLLCALFSLTVNLIAYRRLSFVQLTDILKY